MANYTVAAGDHSIEPWNTVANQVDTVTFVGNVNRVEIISDGAAEVRVTFDGATPAIGTAGTSSRSLRLPAGFASKMDVPLNGPTDVVGIVSSGVAKVSVQSIQ